MQPEISIAISGAVELAKLGLQIWFAQARQAGLDEEAMDVLINSERERFKRNISEPLPDV